MNDERILLDAAYIKLRNNEPMSLTDMQRIAQLIESASFSIQSPQTAEIAGFQSSLIKLLQDKFMKGQKIE